MNLPVFNKLDSIISDCEALIKEYQSIEQQIGYQLKPGQEKEG